VRELSVTLVQLTTNAARRRMPDPDRQITAKLRRCLVPLLACALGAAAVAPMRSAPAAPLADGGSYVIAAQRGDGPRGATVVSIKGNWTTPCAPTFDRASLDGADLRIDARAVLNLCARETTPYAIEVNAAAALGRTSLPAGIYHLYFYAADGA